MLRFIAVCSLLLSQLASAAQIGVESPEIIATTFRNALIEGDSTLLSPILPKVDWVMQQERARFRQELGNPDYRINLDSLLQTPQFEGGVERNYRQCLLRHYKMFDYLRDRSEKVKLNWKKDARMIVLWKDEAPQGYKRQGSVLIFYKLRGAEVLPYRLDIAQLENGRYILARQHNYVWSRTSRAVDAHLQSKYAGKNYRILSYGPFTKVEEGRVTTHQFTATYAIDNAVFARTFVVNTDFEIEAETAAITEEQPDYSPDLTWLGYTLMNAKRYKPKYTNADRRREAFMQRLAEGDNKLELAEGYLAAGDTAAAKTAAATAYERYSQAIPYAPNFATAYYKAGYTLNLFGPDFEGCLYLRKAHAIGLESEDLKLALSACPEPEVPDGSEPDSPEEPPPGIEPEQPEDAESEEKEPEAPAPEEEEESREDPE